MLCTCFSSPVEPIIPPKYLKLLTLRIVPYLVCSSLMSAFVAKNSVFPNGICSPTFSAHSSSVSICLIAFSGFVVILYYSFYLDLRKKMASHSEKNTIGIDLVTTMYVFTLIAYTVAVLIIFIVL